ncbi:hypothetical protein J4U00_gp048 [Mycobacterium phage DyoEdafos]|uniref:Uncharacterized protein n=1 Tax=Mycobacterium phage DyoEdafos TaxID=2599860 RepID=A0A5J6TIQ0_9CAUD|nr:hypothetical protein J4U00_gp048 [Mycobacterium phage DyoEdafos]QFG10278.1 hypothetical protein SEA_DYOEDAFOS_48 [Mycobacterium phage DyoEdafos]
MKASERLAERNELLEVIAEIDSDLSGLIEDKSFRAAQQCREMLDARRETARELNALGFSAPELDERLRRRESVPAAGSGDRAGVRDSGGDCVVAKRRIGPSQEAG